MKLGKLNKNITKETVDTPRLKIGTELDIGTEYIVTVIAVYEKKKDKKKIYKYKHKKVFYTPPGQATYKQSYKKGNEIRIEFEPGDGADYHNVNMRNLTNVNSFPIQKAEKNICKFPPGVFTIGDKVEITISPKIESMGEMINMNINNVTTVQRILGNTE